MPLRTALTTGVAAIALVALGAMPAHAEDHVPELQLFEDHDGHAVAADAVTSAYPDGADTVVLTSSQAPPDALASAGLAGVTGPLLPVDHAKLNPATGMAISELGASEVVLLGGEEAIMPAVEQDLRRMEGVEQVRRIDGVNRIDTAARVAIEELAPSEQIGIDHDPDALRGRTVFLANAWTQVDAVPVAPRAHQGGYPTLLTEPDALPARTREALDAFDTQTVVIVGGEAAVGSQVVAELEAEGYDVERVAGSDRYATAVAFAEWVGDGSFGYDQRDVALAGGFDEDLELVRGLVTGAYLSAWAGQHQTAPPGPVVLTDADALPESSERFLAERGDRVERLHVLRQLREDGPTIGDGVLDAARDAASD